MSSVSERIQWVVREEKLFPSLRQWALATSGAVSPNTLNDLKNEVTTNPERATMEALALATAKSEHADGRQVSVAWLMFGIGLPYDREPEVDSVYPSRTYAIQALIASGRPSAVIERLRNVGGYKADPGLAHWLRKAAEFVDDFDRPSHEGRVVGE